jgi:hypothetical protein
MVFSPVAGQGWWRFVPVAGQQLQMEAGMRGGEMDLLRILLLGFGTLVLAGVTLLAAANRLEQDDLVYGG